jgi:hypothetical protein
VLGPRVFDKLRPRGWWERDLQRGLKGIK